MINWTWIDYKDRKQLQQISAVYAIRMRGKIQYIGETMQLRTRINGHIGTIKILQETLKVKSVFIGYLPVSIKMRGKVEEDAIFYYKPKHNLRGTGRRRPVLDIEKLLKTK